MTADPTLTLRQRRLAVVAGLIGNIGALLDIVNGMEERSKPEGDPLMPPEARLVVGRMCDAVGPACESALELLGKVATAVGTEMLT